VVVNKVIRAKLEHLRFIVTMENLSLPYTDDVCNTTYHNGMDKIINEIDKILKEV
jgi:soluble cytochrome b562